VFISATSYSKRISYEENIFNHYFRNCNDAFYLWGKYTATLELTSLATKDTPKQTVGSNTVEFEID